MHTSGPVTPTVYDVLILGAGIAGLACARTLAESGQRVCLIEAADRIGGRILTQREGDQVIELGAEFVHGRPPELLALIEEAGLTLVERSGSQLSFADGRLTDDSSGRDGMFDPLDALRTLSGPDLSFKAFLDQGATFAGNAAVREAALSYVEGFNAADATEISAKSLGIQQAAEDSIDGDRVAHIREGYDRLPDFLAGRLRAADATVLLNTRVRAVHWSIGRVAFETAGGELIASKAAITLPLGVLQANTVRIVPEPQAIYEAAALMRMGPVCRFTLLFRTPFWQTLPSRPKLSSQSLHDLSFLFDFGQLPPVWWTMHPERSPSNTSTRSLTGWVGGPRSQSLLFKDRNELADLGCRALARIFALPESILHDQLEACVSHDWSADSNSLGSYSYVGVGGVRASSRMAEPVEHTLYFAGEHTDTTGHWGTVHGALRSGLRAAQQILNTH